jgi:hypothetical protein
VLLRCGELRVRFCKWALTELDDGAIFIFCDESYVYIGGDPRRVTVMKGTPAEEVAVQQRKARFCTMFLGAMCEDISVPRPCFTWSPDEKLDKVGDITKLAEINTYWNRQVLIGLDVVKR